MLRRYLIANICPPLLLVLMGRPMQAAFNALFCVLALLLIFREGWWFTGIAIWAIAACHPLTLYDHLRTNARVAHARRMYETRGIHIYPK